MLGFVSGKVVSIYEGTAVVETTVLVSSLPFRPTRLTVLKRARTLSCLLIFN